MYLKSVAFSTGFAIGNVYNVEYNLLVSEFEYVDTNNYIYQDLKYLDGCQIKETGKEGIIISSNMAKKISNQLGFGDDLKQICNECFSFNDLVLPIIAIYKADHNYKCMNNYYFEMGDIAFIHHGDTILFERESINYYFSICPNKDISSNCYSASSMIGKTISFPDYSFNYLNKSDYSVNAYVQDYKNKNKALFIFMAFLFLIVYICSICFAFATQLKEEQGGGKYFLTIIGLLSAIGFVLLAIFSKCLPNSLLLFGKRILLINVLSCNMFLVTLFLFVVELAIVYFYKNNSSRLLQTDNFYIINI